MGSLVRYFACPTCRIVGWYPESTFMPYAYEYVKCWNCTNPVGVPVDDKGTFVNRSWFLPLPGEFIVEGHPLPRIEKRESLIVRMGGGPVLDKIDEMAARFHMNEKEEGRLLTVFDGWPPDLWGQGVHIVCDNILSQRKAEIPIQEVAAAVAAVVRRNA